MAAGYWLSLAGLVGMLVGVHFGHFGAAIASAAVLLVGIILNLAGETRASRRNPK